MGLAFQMNHCAECTPLQDVKIDHVSLILQSPRTFMILGAPEDKPIRNVIFTNNIVTVPSGSAVTGMGPRVPCAIRGQSAEQRIGSCIVSADFRNNVLIGGGDHWPRGNFNSKDTRAAQLARAQEGADYRLLPSSPYKRAGTDRKDLGADVDAVEKATAGVL
jgi:hypothetical protein